jgi:branched-chain amino acid aminotransferase
MAVAIPVTRSKEPRKKPDAAALGFGRFFSDHMFVMDWTPEKKWHDARVVPYAPMAMDPAAAVFHYGQAIFEGNKAYRGADGTIRFFRMPQHLARFQHSAARLVMPEPDMALLGAGMHAVVATDRDWVPSAPGTSLYLRPTLIGTEGFLGVRASNKYTCFVILSPAGSYFEGPGLSPVKIWVERTHTRAAKGGLGEAKAGANYAASLLAAVEAKKRGYPQVLWLDASEHKYVEEVGTMNLCAVIGGKLITPPLEGTILPGVTRDSVLTLAKSWGLEVQERKLPLDELLESSKTGALAEVFGTGTAAVISPVGELAWEGGKLSVSGGKVGPIAQKLFDALTDIQYGRAKDAHGWMTELQG